MSVRTILAMAAAAALAPAMSAAAQPGPQGGAAVYVNAANSASFTVTMQDVLVSSVKSAANAATSRGAAKRVGLPIGARAATAALSIGRVSEFITPESGQDLVIGVTPEFHSEAGGKCKVAVTVTIKPGATRVDVPLGDVARFFDATGKPRSGSCDK